MIPRKDCVKEKLIDICSDHTEKDNFIMYEFEGPVCFYTFNKDGTTKLKIPDRSIAFLKMKGIDLTPCKAA